MDTVPTAVLSDFKPPQRMFLGFSQMSQTSQVILNQKYGPNGIGYFAYRSRICRAVAKLDAPQLGVTVGKSSAITGSSLVRVLTGFVKTQGRKQNPKNPLGFLGFSLGFGFLLGFCIFLFPGPTMYCQFLYSLFGCLFF